MANQILKPEKEAQEIKKLSDYKTAPIEKENSKPSQEQPEQKQITKQKSVEKPKLSKKFEAVACGRNMSISKKQAMYVSKFIKLKPIDKAINDLEKVIKFKQAIPFKGEIPHRKGKMMSGRYPIKASKLFINLLKSLKGNVLVNQMELEKTLITIASPSWASRPMRRKSRRAKRTNVLLIVKEISDKGENK